MKKFLYNLRVVVASIVSFSIGIPGTVILSGLVAIFSLMNLRTIPRLIILFWSRFSFWIVLRMLHVTGKENIKKGKAYLVVSNHGSYYDIPAIMSFCPDISWVARASLFRFPIFGFALKKIGAVSIDSSSIRKAGEAIEMAAKQAKKNRSVGIFPEGTRSIDGKLQDFKRGFIRILRNSELDILPVTLNGFHTLWKRGTMVIDPAKKLEIFIHPPIPREKLVHLEDTEIIEITRKAIEKNLKYW